MSSPYFTDQSESDPTWIELTIMASLSPISAAILLKSEVAPCCCNRLYNVGFIVKTIDLIDGSGIRFQNFLWSLVQKPSYIGGSTID